ncbi:MAG: DUF2243 domain-containing protein [Nocardioides sp.]|nr:DUF2243 domain-containing protein [Nocardioides sp.]
MTTRGSGGWAGGRRPPSKASGLLYGLGLGGFVDGILLHQVLQWHHMVSAVPAYPVDTVAGLEANTLADGFFHVATWFFVVGGALAALHAWRPGPRRAELGLVVGWLWHRAGLRSMEVHAAQVR